MCISAFVLFASEKQPQINLSNWTFPVSLHLVKMLTKFQANLLWQKRTVHVLYWSQMKKSASSLTIQVIICESKVRACERWPSVLCWLLLADEFTKCVIFYTLSHQKCIIIKECFYLCLMYFGWVKCIWTISSENGLQQFSPKFH